MADVNISPNMNLPVPVSGTTIGPDWANDYNNSLVLVDAHDHSPGNGVPISPDGLYINSDLTFNNTNNAIALRSTRFYAQSAVLSLGTDVGCLYVVGNELYYNDVSGGHNVQLTNNGSVAGSAGTITGLPSGTASAAYQSGSGTFQFLQATSTAANIDAGTLVVRYPGSYPSPSGNYIAIRAPNTLASGYNITLPALPSANNTFLTMSTAGVISTAITVDNSTIALSANTLIVKSAGITATQLASNAVTTAKILDSNVTNPKLQNLNYIESSSSGPYSTSSLSYGDVTNLTVNITTTNPGRKLRVELAPDGSSPAILGSGTSSGPAYGIVNILRSAPGGGGFVQIAEFTLYEIAGALIFFMDAPATAATYTYKIQAKVTNTILPFFVAGIKLVAFEP